MSKPSFSVLKPHVKDLGGFSVKRLLPGHPTRMVGPFIFFDHMGPADFVPGQGIDVRPHPHIGLATVTYLFEGRILHRDSLGSKQPINPGDVNWMTAGHGIVHSERTPPALRETGGALHGIQTWVALPSVDEAVEPGFAHHPAATLPQIELPGVRMRLIAGTAFGRTAPARTFSPLFYLAAEMEAGAEFRLPPEHAERAVYAVDAPVRLDGQTLGAHQMAVLDRGQELTIAAESACRVMLCGGEPVDGDRFIWWNFVASRKELIAEAKERWREQRFGQVPDETEWIPLPEEPRSPEAFS